SRVPCRGERHEECHEVEVHEAVEEDRCKVHPDEDDGRAADEAMQVEEPRGRRPPAEHLGREQEPPDDGVGKEYPGDEAAGPRDSPPDRPERIAPRSRSSGRTSPSASPPPKHDHGVVVTRSPPASTSNPATPWCSRKSRPSRLPAMKAPLANT